MKALNPCSAPASSRTKDQRERAEERKEAKRMKRVWSSRRRWRRGEKGYASRRGQRPRVRALQTRQRGPLDHSEVC